MAKLMFLFACSVLCVAFAQETTVPSETTLSSGNQHEASPNPAQPPANHHETTMNRSSGAPEQAEGTQTSVAGSEASAPTGKKGEIAGSVPLDPSAQAATSNTTETPKGGSATVGANTVLFLLGAVVLLKL